MTYTLVGTDGRPYQSAVPGALGGHRRARLYGRLDCPSALRAIARGGYVRHRVFFADAPTAIAAGYRPCAICLPDAYRLWRATLGATPTAPNAPTRPGNAPPGPESAALDPSSTAQIQHSPPRPDTTAQARHPAPRPDTTASDPSAAAHPDAGSDPKVVEPRAVRPKLETVPSRPAEPEGAVSDPPVPGAVRSRPAALEAIGAIPATGAAGAKTLGARSGTTGSGPDVGEPRPDAARLRPGAATLRPDAAGLRSGAAGLTPEATTLLPGAAALMPDVAEPGSGWSVVSEAELGMVVELVRGSGARRVVVGCGRGAWAVTEAFVRCWEGEVLDVVSWPETAASWLRQARRFVAGEPDAWVVAGEPAGWAGMSERLRRSTAWEPGRTYGFASTARAVGLAPPGALEGMRGADNDGNVWRIGRNMIFRENS